MCVYINIALFLVRLLTWQLVTVNANDNATCPAGTQILRSFMFDALRADGKKGCAGEEYASVKAYKRYILIIPAHS